MKIGFIGFGSMGRAIAEGLLARNVCTPEDIYACAGHFDKLQETADKLGIHAERTAADVVAKSDWVVPAVVPAILEDVLWQRRKRLFIWNTAKPSRICGSW